MPYVPGDNLVICDLTGKKVLMSQTRKTWDGLRIWEKVWYPKHPQLSLRAIPDHMAVIDGRSRQADIFAVIYGRGSFCLVSPDGTNYIVWIDDDGAVIATVGTLGIVRDVFYIGQYGITVDNNGGINVADSGINRNIMPWKMYSPTGIGYDVSIDIDLAMLVTVI